MSTGTQKREPTPRQESADGAQRAFNMAIVVSGIRCTLTYVLLPFVTPIIGLAPGVGPVLGMGLSAIAIAANVASIVRFHTSNHRLRRPIILVNSTVIVFLCVLIGVDVAALG